ncbi:hypothetical protein DFH28DRAFT_928335 [Melampsora americana]|nr:hypothetical protein DFH28DRAFT_928335 [Melampsora americana]
MIPESTTGRKVLVKRAGVGLGIGRVRIHQMDHEDLIYQSSIPITPIQDRQYSAVNLNNSLTSSTSRIKMTQSSHKSSKVSRSDVCGIGHRETCGIIKRCTCQISSTGLMMFVKFEVIEDELIARLI